MTQETMINVGKTRGGKREGAGRKIINGNNPKTTTVCLSPEILKKCKERHGSLANALRYAAETDEIYRIF